MTKRSLKGTNITTRAGLTRDGFASIWLSDTLPDSAKDNPLSLPVLQDVIAANIKAILDGGFITLSDSTNDVVAFAPSSVIDVSGSVYTVLEVFYIYVNGNIFKVNTGSATLTDTIRLIVSSTEDGLFQTADIDDGASVASFGGTTAGDGIVNYSNIFWLNDTFDINETGDVTMGGGDVSISNGNLSVTSADATMLTLNRSTAAGVGITFANTVGDLANISALSDKSLDFRTNGSSTVGMNIDSSQNVSIPNGDLSVEGELELRKDNGNHYIYGENDNTVNTLWFTESDNNPQLGGFIRYDGANNDFILGRNNGSGDVTVLTYDRSSSDISIPNGALNLVSNALLAVGSSTSSSSFYETGTFTPTIIGDSTTGAGTYSTQTGAYTRIGNLVHISGIIVWSAHTGTGDLKIRGLPSLNPEQNAAISLWCSSLDKTADHAYQAFIRDVSGTTQIDVYEYNVATTTGTTFELDMVSAATIYFSGTYITNDSSY